MVKFGFLKYFGKYDRYKCNYCNTNSNVITEQIWLNHISAETYQYLIDHGWRRCGLLCYKVIESDCCTHYTIRCESLNFELTKSKRKILKNMKNFLFYDIKPKKLINENTQLSNNDFPKIKLNSEKKFNQKLILNNNKSKLNLKIDLEQLRKSSKAKSKRILKRIEKIKKKSNCQDEEAISILIKKREEKLNKSVSHKLEDYLNYNFENAKHNLEIKIVLANDDSKKHSYVLYKKYQTQIHKSDESELSFKNFESSLIKNPLYDDNFTKDNLNFVNNLPTKYGTYHMQYWLDNKLIAVNVIDILTECVSSIYFFYDPDYSFLNLGTYSALREIDLVKKYNLINPQIKYYYMGYYIENCIKMRYKGAFNHSYLLCPTTYKFIQFEYCKLNYDLTKKQKLDPNPEDSEDAEAIDLNNILVLYNNQFIVSFSFYKSKNNSKLSEKDLTLIQEFASNFDKKFFQSNVLLID